VIVIGEGFGKWDYGKRTFALYGNDKEVVIFSVIARNVKKHGM
jgi:hypothetical protein